MQMAHISVKTNRRKQGYTFEYTYIYIRIDLKKRKANNLKLQDPLPIKNKILERNR